MRVRLEGHGPSVVLACDPPNVLEHYDTLVAALSPHARVAVFEPPGFGFSTTTRPEALRPADQAGAVAALLSSLGGGPHVLVFPCVMGQVAALVAATRPDLVQALVLPQVPSLDEHHAWARRVDRGGILHTPLLGQFVVALGRRAIARRWYRVALPDQDAEGRYARTALAAMKEGAAFPLADAFQAFARADPPPAIPARIPVLHVWGDRDPTHRRSDKTSRVAPHAEVVHLEGTGHFPELEAPERFVARVMNWLQRAA